MADLHLEIEGEIGTDVTPKYIRQELASMPNADNIILHINSPGGGVYDGDTIAGYLADTKINKIALIEGYCGSIATRIANACDVRKIIPTGSYMIHYASIRAQGNKEDLQKSIDDLNDIDKKLIADYQRVTGMSFEDIDSYMQEERSFNAEDALKFGFVDEVLEQKKAVAKFDLKMENEQEVTGILAKIQEGINNLLKTKEPKNQEPENISLELEDGNMIWVRSEDGELEGKEVFMADEEGNPTDTPAPNGTHRLRDGRSITVEDGRVMSVQEAEDRNREIEDLKAENDSLKDQLKAKEEAEAEAKAEALKAEENTQAQLTALVVLV